MDGLGTCYLELGTCTSGWDYSAHPVLRPFGAGLRPFKIAPGDFVEPRCLRIPTAPYEKRLLQIPNRVRIRKSRFKWRRGWDSNPRKATNLCRFSRPVHSTALPPLQIVSIFDASPSWTLYKRLYLHLHIPDRCIQPLCHLSKSSLFLMRVLHGPSTKGSTFTFISQTGAFNRSATSPKSHFCPNFGAFRLLSPLMRRTLGFSGGLKPCEGGIFTFLS